MIQSCRIHGVILALCILFFLPKAFCNTKDTSKPVVFRLFISYPIAVKNGRAVKLTNPSGSILIVKFKDLTLYRLMPSVNLLTDKEIPGSEQYFVRRQSDSVGRLFERLTDTVYKTITADSFLAKRAFSTTRLGVGDNDRLVKRSVKDGTTIEYFVPVKKQNEFVFDSTIFYYNTALSDLPYSFSPELDHNRKSKLFKARLVYNKYYSKQYGATVPKREYLFELKKTDLKQPEAIMKLFEIAGKD